MEDILHDLDDERERILFQLREKRTRKVELDLAVADNQKELYVLEGRLVEVDSILKYLKEKSADEKGAKKGEM